MQKLELICADAVMGLRAIDDNRFDAVIADPPYSSGGLHQGDRNPADDDDFDMPPVVHAKVLQKEKIHATGKPRALYYDLIRLVKPGGEAQRHGA